MVETHPIASLWLSKDQQFYSTISQQTLNGEESLYWQSLAKQRQMKDQQFHSTIHWVVESHHTGSLQSYTAENSLNHFIKPLTNKH